MDQIRNELMHYGILGMKWGVRRYQNPDGSYTSAGKKRYISDKTASARESKDSSRIEKQTAKASQKWDKQTNKKADKEWGKSKNFKALSEDAMKKLETNKNLSQQQLLIMHALNQESKVSPMPSDVWNNSFQYSFARAIDAEWAKDNSLYNPSGTKRLGMAPVVVGNMVFMNPVKVKVKATK